MIEELGEAEVKAKDRAQGLGALAGVIKLVYRWHEEPSVEEMKHAQTAAINLPLIATRPEDLKKLALARGGRLEVEGGAQMEEKAGRSE
jgi:hypothetical protein